MTLSALNQDYCGRLAVPGSVVIRQAADEGPFTISSRITIIWQGPEITRSFPSRRSEPAFRVVWV